MYKNGNKIIVLKQMESCGGLHSNEISQKIIGKQLFYMNVASLRHRVWSHSHSQGQRRMQICKIQIEILPYLSVDHLSGGYSNSL